MNIPNTCPLHVGASLAPPGSGSARVPRAGMGVPPMPSVHAETFTYDPLGNRTKHTDTTNTVGASQAKPAGTHQWVGRYQTNNLNQYTKINGTPLSYDLNGNLIDDGKQRYRYDAQNRLIEVESATVKAVFAYDALNRCILRRYFTRSESGEWILNEKDSLALTYDSAWNLLVDRDLTGKQTAAYIHGNHVDEILANIQTAKTYYSHGDALGSVIALTDRNGRLESAVRYTAYGLPVNAPAYHRFLYTGREWLGAVDLSEHRFRYYNPMTGRWLTTDPIRFDGGDKNLYRAVRNTSTNLLDANGLFDDGTTAKGFLGHDDFYGNDCFDFTAEDHDPATAPTPIGGNPAGHFQDFATSSAQVEDATLACDPYAFERAMHRLQDFYTHWDKGYRWEPRKCKFGHASSILPWNSNPDNDPAAWARANAETQARVDKFMDSCGGHGACTR